MDFIVVETLNDAENCITFLKENNIGVATFICLDRMLSHQPNRLVKFNTPKNSERLFDLISCKDDKFLNAFYFALKDTLVANDIKTASEIVFKNNAKK